MIEGNEMVTNCECLKMLAIDSKMRFTDIAELLTIIKKNYLLRRYNTNELLRIS